MIANIADRWGLSFSALRLQSLLHLPRLMPPEPTSEDMQAEVSRLAHREAMLVDPVRGWLSEPEEGVASPLDLAFGPVPDDVASNLFERLHYLHSHRPGSIFLGLKTKRDARPVAIVSISPLDIPEIADVLPPPLLPSSTRVVSRIYAFPWAPRNTVSHLLARASKWLRERGPNVIAQLTYVNPNLGFTAASYRASNWVPFAREEGTRYAYLDGYYVTDRSLAERFGSSDPSKLRHLLGQRYEATTVPLRPLRLYIYLLERKHRRMFPHGFRQVVRRPEWQSNRTSL